MDDIEHHRIGAVPVFHAEGPLPFVAELIFRVGQADEPLPSRGITHLVEHVVLSAVPDVEYAYNGSVGLVTTRFTVRGDEADVAGFLATVTTALRHLPRHRIDAERRILSTEAGHHAANPATALLAARFGATGPGAVAHPEYGLHQLTAGDLAAWTARWFTDGNAALWVQGPRLPRLALDLPAGRRPPAPAHPPLDQPLPAWFTADFGGIAVDVLSPRSPAANLALRTAETRARALLRRERGIAYTVGTDHHVLGADLVQTWLWADSLPDHADEVRDELLALLERLAAEGPTGDELDAERRMARRAETDPAAVPARLARHADDALLQRPLRTSADRVDDIADVTPSDVAAALRQLLSTAVVMVPPGVSGPGAPFTRIADWSASRVSGRTYRPRRLTHEQRPRIARRLVVGADGVTLLPARNSPATVRFADCAVALRWDDGSHVLVGRDGFRVAVRPREWRRGTAAARRVATGVPSDRVVAMGAPPVASTPRTRNGLARFLLLAAVFFPLILLLSSWNELSPAEDVLRRAGIPVTHDVDCGGSSFAVLADGPRIDDADLSAADRQAVERICTTWARRNVRLTVVVGAAGAVVGGGTLLVTWLRRRREARPTA